MQNTKFKDLYRVNKSLEDEIFSAIPNHFDNLEQAIFIYYQLCKKLDYSIDYFLNGMQSKFKFSNLDNLEKVDGKTHKDVVCYTFDKIFLKMLLDRGLILEENFAENCSYSMFFGILLPEHSKLSLKIDGKQYYADATMGIFRDCDLTMCKFAHHNIGGWMVYGKDDDAKFQLNRALQTVENFCKSDFDKLVDAYVSHKMSKNDLDELSLDVRINMFLNAVIQNANDGSVNSLAYIYQLKYIFFKTEEVSNYFDAKQKVAVVYVKNPKTNNVSTVVMYNVGTEMKAYQIDHSVDRQTPCDIRRVGFDDVVQAYKSGQLCGANESSRAFKEAVESIKNAVKLSKINCQNVCKEKGYE